MCAGTESTIFECAQNIPGDHDCRHVEDIGVLCQTRNGNYYYAQTLFLSCYCPAENATDANDLVNIFKIVGYSLSGAVAVLTTSLTIVIITICYCNRRRKKLKRVESDYMCMQ